MRFISCGDRHEIIYEEGDTDTEKRIVEQALAFIRNLLIRLKEIDDKLSP